MNSVVEAGEKQRLGSGLRFCDSLSLATELLKALGPKDRHGKPLSKQEAERQVRMCPKGVAQEVR
jgi:hypothetical protein